MDNRYLFRGKRLDNGEWVIGFYYSRTKGAWVVPIQSGHFIMECRELNGGEIISVGDHEVDPATFGQCTGLTDKNGKLIFEGDICKDSLGWVLEVLWDKKNARFLGRHSKPRGDTYICYVGREPPVEIIGNVHDHPVLLQPGATP